MSDHLCRRRLTLLLVIMYVCYALAFITTTSFTIAGTRYFSLFDDAMISMCYGRTLAGGHGLVWYPGAPRVEGYTNLLWVLGMAALHLLPVPGNAISLLVQLAGLLCGVAVIGAVVRLAGELPRAPVMVGTAAAAPILENEYLRVALGGYECALRRDSPRIIWNAELLRNALP